FCPSLSARVPVCNSLLINTLTLVQSASTAFPGNLFLYRQRRMSKGFTELFGWFLFTLVYFPAVDHHVVIGTGTDALPVMKEVKREAKRRKDQTRDRPDQEGHPGVEARDSGN